MTRMYPQSFVRRVSAACDELAAPVLMPVPFGDQHDAHVTSYRNKLWRDEVADYCAARERPGADEHYPRCRRSAGNEHSTMYRSMQGIGR